MMTSLKYLHTVVAIGLLSCVYLHIELWWFLNVKMAVCWMLCTGNRKKKFWCKI